MDQNSIIHHDTTQSLIYHLVHGINGLENTGLDTPVRSLILQTFPDAFAGDLQDPIELYRSNLDNLFILALKQGDTTSSAVGMITASLVRNSGQLKEVEVSSHAVSEEFRGKGVGTTLADLCIKHAPDLVQQKTSSLIPWYTFFPHHNYLGLKMEYEVANSHLVGMWAKVLIDNGYSLGDGRLEVRPLAHTELYNKTLRLQDNGWILGFNRGVNDFPLIHLNTFDHIGGFIPLVVTDMLNERTTELPIYNYNHFIWVLDQEVSVQEKFANLKKRMQGWTLPHGNLTPGKEHLHFTCKVPLRMLQVVGPLRTLLTESLGEPVYHNCTSSMMMTAVKKLEK